MAELTVAAAAFPELQAKERPDILNVGGFSNQVFEVISEFARGELTADHWMGVIDSVAV